MNQYLPDPSQRENRTKVYLEVDPLLLPRMTEVEALKWLQDHSGSVLLEDLHVDNPHLSVRLGVLGNDGIRLGFSPPSRDLDADRDELLRVLAANGVRARLT